MKSIAFALASLLCFQSVQGACIYIPPETQEFLVESCEAIQPRQYPWLWETLQNIDDVERQINLLEQYSGVVVTASMDATSVKYYLEEAPVEACAALIPRQRVSATIDRECCDGGGGVPCSLGFSEYIAEYELVQ